ncbi:hypothetical protein SAMN05216326_12024 [Nitrosomonas marina]|uniref:Uncharacterized protein n=1 Tax=Nitrosomonas marina TaxID=917 RepID=A0A1I0DHB4_9PROT|nr:hypothetical protein [Nitrosomonas marina]SET31831.1 hypothetical protein SAMN05216326_12024 [Nitrosomonas marina]
MNALRDALSSFSADDPVKAHNVLNTKKKLNRNAEALRLRLGRDLTVGKQTNLGTYRLAMDHVENLKRIHTLAKRVARLVLKTLEAENSVKLK